MDFEKLSLILAVALGVSSIISPVITTLLNCIYQYFANKQDNDFKIKLKNLELYFPAKNQAIDNYLDCLSKYLSHQTDTNFYNYQVSMAKVSMYVSSEIKNAISSIDLFINEKNFKKASELISDSLSPELYKENIKKAT